MEFVMARAFGELRARLFARLGDLRLRSRVETGCSRQHRYITISGTSTFHLQTYNKIVRRHVILHSRSTEKSRERGHIEKK
jgi:hypothetical protein